MRWKLAFFSESSGSLFLQICWDSYGLRNHGAQKRITAIEGAKTWNNVIRLPSLVRSEVELNWIVFNSHRGYLLCSQQQPNTSQTAAFDHGEAMIYTEQYVQRTRDERDLKSIGSACCKIVPATELLEQRAARTLTLYRRRSSWRLEPAISVGTIVSQ